MLIAFCVLTNLFSCFHDSDLDKEEIPGDSVADTIFVSTRADQKPDNEVYFIPKDFVSAYESNVDTINSRLSEAMLFAQKWYKKQMELGGYADKTFALFTRNSNTELRVIPVYGEKASDQYTGNKGVRTEITTYMESIPELIGGQHTLVLCNDGTGFQNNASGRIAIARSSDDFDMVNTGKTIDDLDLYTSEGFGTLLHELGHALNAPHVAHQASELPYKSLMGGGGTNRWKAGYEDEVKLVASSIAVFNTSEAFNKTNSGIDYYTVNPSVKLTGYTIEKDNSIQATKASFTFTSESTAKYLYVSMDAEPNAPNKNYDLVAFTTVATPTGNPNEYTAALEMPYAEFFNNYSSNGIKTDNLIELSVNILTENGFREIPLSYNYTISSNNQPEPDDNINKELKPLSDRSAWAITTNTTSHGQPIDQAAAKMLDSDLSTFWFSDWPTESASNTPHIINVDMGEEKNFTGIYLNSLRTPNPQFRPKHILVEVSTDRSVYSLAADFTQPINSQEVSLIFDNPQTARHIRITVDEVYTTNGVENLVINELDIITD